MPPSRRDRPSRRVVASRARDGVMARAYWRAAILVPAIVSALLGPVRRLCAVK
jgi:hypothetical protein